MDFEFWFLFVMVAMPTWFDSLFIDSFGHLIFDHFSTETEIETKS